MARKFAVSTRPSSQIWKEEMASSHHYTSSKVTRLLDIGNPCISLRKYNLTKLYDVWPEALLSAETALFIVCSVVKGIGMYNIYTYTQVGISISGHPLPQYLCVYVTCVRLIMKGVNSIIYKYS